MARYIAEARAARDDAAGSQIASTALAFFTAVALVATPLLALAGIPLTSLFGVDGDLLPEARLCFALVAGQLLFELPARSFLASLEGVQRYGLYQVVELSRALTQAALIIVVLVADLGIAGMGGAVMLDSLVVLAVAFVLTRRTVPEIRVAPRYVSREAMRKLVSFGSQFFFVRVMATNYRQIDKAIISIAMGPRFVTGYEVANRIHQGAAMVQSIASSALLPATAFHHASRQVLRDLFLRGTNYTVALSLPVAVAAMIFADDLIRTWIGDFMVDSADAARIFLVFLILAVFQTVGGAMLVALGDMRFVIAATVVFSVANLGLSIALVGPLGVNGVILGLVIAQALVEPAFVLRFMRRFEVGIGEILRATVMPNIPGVVAQLVTAVPLVYLADRSDRLWEVGLILIDIRRAVAGDLLAHRPWCWAARRAHRHAAKRGRAEATRDGSCRGRARGAVRERVRRLQARLSPLGNAHARAAGPLDRLAARVRRPLDRRFLARFGRLDELEELSRDCDAAAPAPASDAPRILVVALRAFPNHTAYELAIAQALRLRGADVALMTCGGGQPACEMGWARRVWPRPCDRCAHYTDRLADLSGLRTVRLRDSAPGAQTRVAPQDVQATRTLRWTCARRRRLASPGSCTRPTWPPSPRGRLSGTTSRSPPPASPARHLPYSMSSGRMWS